MNELLKANNYLRLADALFHPEKFHELPVAVLQDLLTATSALQIMSGQPEAIAFNSTRLAMGSAALQVEAAISGRVTVKVALNHFSRYRSALEAISDISALIDEMEAELGDGEYDFLVLSMTKLKEKLTSKVGDAQVWLDEEQLRADDLRKKGKAVDPIYTALYCVADHWYKCGGKVYKTEPGFIDFLKHTTRPFWSTKIFAIQSVQTLVDKIKERHDIKRSRGNPHFGAKLEG